MKKIVEFLIHLFSSLYIRVLIYVILAVLVLSVSGVSAYQYYQFKKYPKPKQNIVSRKFNSFKKGQKLLSASQSSAENPKTGEDSNQNNNSSRDNNTSTNPEYSNTEPTVPQTPPDPAESPSATVAFYADSQSDTDGEDQNHLKVVNYILNTYASTVFHAGDLLEDGTVDSLNRFNNVTSTLRTARAFYSAPGNNERNSSVYFDNFNYPGNEHWFSINIGNLHMVILDNYASSGAVGSEQYNWLAADLASYDSQSRITGVMFHYPVYGVGGDTKGLINTFVPLFRDLGVDFVFSGHEHWYQSTNVDGIYYFASSGQPALGYMLANVYSNRVEFTIYNTYNNVIDFVSFNER
ncbi:MAG: metallophosphoesterase [Patescibacteria group bacterium]|nr:metallophosphoesterase [Patescibacteria group bacterium]